MVEPPLSPEQEPATTNPFRWLPGFEREPIRWTREYWVPRRVLRAMWLCIMTGSLLGIIVAGVLVGEGRLPVRNFQLHSFIFQAGCLFTFLAIPISIFGIYQHLEHNTKPHLQRHIVRILWMVPIYALDSWLSLMLGVLCRPSDAIYPDTLRECYEAFTIYSFYSFTVEAIQDLRGVSLKRVLRGKAPIHHWFPLRIVACGREWNLVQPWEMGEPFVRGVSWGILNYVVLKPLMTAITLVLQVWGLYGDGEFSARRGYPYILFINNFSQCWALYCLVLLYEATAEELAPLKPLAKFLCVKGVVFFTFWQQAMLAVMAFFRVFTLNHRWECYTDMHDMINGIQDGLICFEMLGFAIAHAYVFPSREYRVARADTPGAGRARFRSLFDVSDLYAEVVNHVHHEANTITGAVVRNPAVRGVTGVAQFTTDGVRRGLRGARHLFHREDEGDSDGADSHYDALLDGHPLRDKREREVEEHEHPTPETPPPYDEGEMRSPVSPLATAAEHIDLRSSHPPHP